MMLRMAYYDGEYILDDITYEIQLHESKRADNLIILEKIVQYMVCIISKILFIILIYRNKILRKILLIKILLVFELLISISNIILQFISNIYFLHILRNPLIVNLR